MGGMLSTRSARYKRASAAYGSISHAEARRRGDAEDTTKANSAGGDAAFTRWDRWGIACCYDFTDILRASAPPREPIADFG